MGESSGEWAILRQAVIATDDHGATSTAVREAVRLSPGFADPLLADLGLRDETFRIGPQAHLELVSPLPGEAALTAWLAKVGGTAGYCLSIQVPDVQQRIDAAEKAGVRVLADMRHFGRRIVQLHPKDMGLLVELDEIPEPGEWFWDDVEAESSPEAVADDVRAVEIGSDDPDAQCARWAAVFGGAAEAGGERRFRLGTREVRFVASPVRAMTAVELAGPATAAQAQTPTQTLTLGSVELRLLPAGT